MSRSVEAVQPIRDGVSQRRLLTIAGTLLLGGFVLNAVVTSLWHPSGSEDDHAVIFRKYADSRGWVATHFAQLVLVLIALSGLLVLYLALRPHAGRTVLIRVAAGATVMTAAVWTILQGLDGIALKQAVDAWVDAPANERALRSQTPRRCAGRSGGSRDASASHLASASACSAQRSSSPGSFRRGWVGLPWSPESFMWRRASMSAIAASTAASGMAPASSSFWRS
jgi:hypothetical protein